MGYICTPLKMRRNPQWLKGGIEQLNPKCGKQFTVQGNTMYLDMLSKLVKQYNNTKHSSIKMTPVEASNKRNEGTVYFNLYGDMEPLKQKPKFKTGGQGSNIQV